MKVVNIKFIEIFTDGTVHFNYKSLKYFKQLVLYEKDSKNFLFCKKPTSKQASQNLPQNFYKLKYKF